MVNNKVSHIKRTTPTKKNSNHPMMTGSAKKIPQHPSYAKVGKITRSP